MKGDQEEIPQYVWASLGCLECTTCPGRCSINYRLSHGEQVQAGMMRLCMDDRMRPIWERGILSWVHMAQAAEEFSASLDRDHWATKTQRERDLWADKFCKTVEILLELMEQGPVTPRQYGFPARDLVLANLARCLGATVPIEPSMEPNKDGGLDDEVLEYWSRIMELESAADAEGWTIADALISYRNRQLAAGSQEQLVRKPGDPKASRAQFITCFKDSCSHLHSIRDGKALPPLSAQVVATIASVIFEDEAIDERLVRRLTREDSSES